MAGPIELERPQPEGTRPNGEPRRSEESAGDMPRSVFFLLLLIALFGALGGGFAIATALTEPEPEQVLQVRASPPVLQSVKELARLETVSFHMERVIELKEEQRRAYGLLTAEDSILLVAAADVSAGVDLQALGPGDVTIDEENKRAKLKLPAPVIFNISLDEEHTYVHSRTTDLLAKRNLGLEGQARKAALKELEAAARSAGILSRAETGARKTLESLLKSLGYTEVEIEFAAAPSPAPALPKPVSPDTWGPRR